MMSSYKECLDLNGLDEEDDLSDDEVFTRGGKSIPLEENGINKPLMAPRHRSKDGLQTKVRKVPSLRVIWAPIFYFLVTLCTVISIICLVVFLINTVMKNVSKNHKSISATKMLPCSKISSKDVWVKSFPMLTTETAIRLNDVNLDGIEDIILGFGTGADAFYYPLVVCRVYFPKAKDGCGGGVMALDGKTGAEIWRHYTAHEIFAINCNVDLNGDSVKDCLGGGRMATFTAISGKDGLLLWEFDDQNAKIDTSNVYTPQYIRDVDFDGVPDLIVIHGGDPMKEPGSETRLVGRLMIISGKTGRVLKWVPVPDKKETYYSPQVLTQPDGTNVILFGTGGETHGGSLWFIKLNHLLTGEINMARKMYTDNHKGIMTPPVLVDITGDGVSDIIMAMFNSTVIAFDGQTFSRLWDYHQPSSESYSTPGVGYFDNDSIPDFMINYQTGPGFPIYYYTQTTILSGMNGKPLLSKPIKMVVGTQASPLVISVQGRGNDIFLYWVSDCHNAQNQSQLEFDFVKGTSVHDQSRADFCKLRFKEKLFTKMHALSSHIPVPGAVIYDSDLRKGTEYSNPINYSALGLEFLYRHPEFQQDYERYLEDENYQLENNILQEDLADIPNQYDNIRLQKLLRNQQNLGSGKYNNLDAPPINEYSVQDYPNDDGVYPPFYAQQNLGNEQYYPLEYYRESQPGREERNMPLQKLKRKNARMWSHQKHQLNSVRPQYAVPQRLRSRPQLMQKKTVFREPFKPSRESGKKRNVHKRHVGPHDGGGIQRIISTGTLAPSLSNGKGVIDVVYATFWFYPSAIQGLLPVDKECIEKHMKDEKQRFEVTSEFYGMDHDAYEEMVTEECLKSSGHLRNIKESIKKGYNPFNRPMGQMTVYRTQINCSCSTSNVPSNHCAQILPFNQQMWTSYLGLHGDSVARRRKFL